MDKKAISGNFGMAEMMPEQSTSMALPLDFQGRLRPQDDVAKRESKHLTEKDVADIVKMLVENRDIDQVFESFAEKKGMEVGAVKDALMSGSGASNTGPAHGKGQRIFRQEFVNYALDAYPEIVERGDWKPVIDSGGPDGMWPAEARINMDETYNLPDTSFRPMIDTLSYEGTIVYQNNVGGKSMDKIAELREAMADALDESEDMKDQRKELGITLNATGMPTVDFRDGSFIEVREKLVDDRRRHQGVDDGTEFMVIATYPSLQYETEIGMGGYRTIEAAENMLVNYSKVRIARGLTFTP